MHEPATFSGLPEASRTAGSQAFYSTPAIGEPFPDIRSCTHHMHALHRSRLLFQTSPRAKASHAFASMPSSASDPPLQRQSRQDRLSCYRRTSCARSVRCPFPVPVSLSEFSENRYSKRNCHVSAEWNGRNSGTAFRPTASCGEKCRSQLPVSAARKTYRFSGISQRGFLFRQGQPPSFRTPWEPQEYRFPVTLCSLSRSETLSAPDAVQTKSFCETPHRNSPIVQTSTFRGIGSFPMHQRFFPDFQECPRPWESAGNNLCCSRSSPP